METVLILVILTFSAFVQGVTGLGYALVASPLLLQFADPTALPVMFSVVSVFLNLFLYKAIDKPADKRGNGIILAGILGLPIGILLLRVFPAYILKKAVCMVILLTVGLLFVHPPKRKPGTVSSAITGFVAGILQTSVGVNGPILYLLLASGMNTDPTRVRKTLAKIFSVFGLVSFVLFMSGGPTEMHKMPAGFLVLPGVWAGAWAGNKVAGSMPRKLLKTIAFALIVSSALYTLTV